ncbi:MAG: class I SAM-dependent methyltransferase, partial [Rhizobiales bacterium]|nr:class I SAM-dependent methyltransferase [Hyphomicrobiales bacterium]
QRVLDVGCGPGWFWASVADALPPQLDLTLSDLSEGMVEEAVERCGPLPFGHLAGVPADAMALPFADGTFDAVVAMHMFYHLADPAKGMAEAYRVLRPGGFLAVTTNGVGNMRALYALNAVFGVPPVDPAGLAFGCEAAERLMGGRFGNVVASRHPARLRVTEPEDVFLALTSYPPGDGADAAQLAALRAAIDEAFAAGGGVLDTKKESVLFLSRKDA